MDDVEKLLKAALGEVEHMLNSKTVVGEPISIEGNTLIPLVSVGFGFGAGGGTGRESTKGEGKGVGTGGGGGIKPVAVLIINKEGIRLEPIRGAAASVFEKVAETIGKVAKKQGKDSSQ